MPRRITASARSQTEDPGKRAGAAWLMADAYRRTKTNELTLLLEHSKGEVQNVHAKLSDTQKALDERMKRLSEQISRALKGDSKF